MWHKVRFVNGVQVEPELKWLIVRDDNDHLSKDVLWILDSLLVL